MVTLAERRNPFASRACRRAGMIMPMSRPVRSPEIAELRAFCAAADLGSLTRAARLLQLSQPALSKRLKALEALIGSRLLDRSSREVELTHAGRHLYAEARKLLDQMQAVEELAGGLRGEEPPIRLAVSHTIAEFVLPMVLATYEAPSGQHLSLDLTVANSTTVRKLVGEGEADVGVAALPPEGSADDLEEVLFCQDEVVIVVPPVHTWSQYEEVPLRSFLRTRMIMRDPQANSRRIVEAALARSGHKLAPALLEVGSTVAAKQAADAHRAPALLSAMAVKGDRRFKTRRVKSVRFSRSFAILCASAERNRRSAWRSATRSPSSCCRWSWPPTKPPRGSTSRWS